MYTVVSFTADRFNESSINCISYVTYTYLEYTKLKELFLSGSLMQLMQMKRNDQLTKKVPWESRLIDQSYWLSLPWKQANLLSYWWNSHPSPVRLRKLPTPCWPKLWPYNLKYFNEIFKYELQQLSFHGNSPKILQNGQKFVKKDVKNNKKSPFFVQ
jgi:hypothetical protein